MPYVNVKLLRGVSVAQKKQLVTGITQLLVERLAKKPEHIHIVIEEIAPQNWGFAGKLTSELQGVAKSAPPAIDHREMTSSTRACARRTDRQRRRR